MTLRVGLLNMMPDAALVVTERQFGTLMGANAGRDVQLLRYTFSAIARGPAVAGHVRDTYRDACEMRAGDFDVLVITGANVSDPLLPRQRFWPALVERMAWALAAGVPVLCSCLATHAVLEARHGQRRKPVSPKVWGVYEHELVVPGHRLLRGLPPQVAVPHSRHNDLSAEQFVAAGYEVLLASGIAGVHLAVERAQGRWLLLQGHPEYEAVSLLKEYKREELRWQAGERVDAPHLPHGYLAEKASRPLLAYRRQCLAARAAGAAYPPFPEEQVTPHLKNTWTTAAVQVVGHWLDTLA